jgi:hypothetical protein
MVRRAYDAFVHGDPTDALDDVDADFVATRVAPLPGVTPYRGPDGLPKMLVDWVEGFDQFEMTPMEFIDADDEQVLVRLHQRAAGAHGRVPIEAEFWSSTRCTTAKLCAWTSTGLPRRRRKAVGLEE